MTKLEKIIQNFEGRKFNVLFVHPCRAKTCKGIARLLNSKFVADCVDLGEDRFFTEDDVAEMLILGFLEQHNGCIYLCFRR